MPADSQSPLLNGSTKKKEYEDYRAELNSDLSKDLDKFARFHGDKLIGDKRRATGRLVDWQNGLDDFRRVFTWHNLPAIGSVLTKMLSGGGLDMKNGAALIGSLSNDSNRRATFIEAQVKTKYDRMLHPPITYIGDAFQFRQADGKFNSAIHPHLGQAGAPYAKTVPSKTHQMGALPDPGDLFDRLLAREEGGRESGSGLSAMLIYHATIIIHDIFRTNDYDKNISDSSSYLDLSPLYGYTEEMVRSIRDDRYKLGLLKPDTFAEDRLLRQPPGVCIMLVMYNRYHNYAATQLRRINENGRFSVPAKYNALEKICLLRHFGPSTPNLKGICDEYDEKWRLWDANGQGETQGFDEADRAIEDALTDALSAQKSAGEIENIDVARVKFVQGWRAAWDKLDDDLFGTARLITCGIYIQIAIHDYLRALMGFHQYNTDFTLDPRLEMKGQDVSRGLGNQVTVEFNLLYRFHCAVSLKDEDYTDKFMMLTRAYVLDKTGQKADPEWDPKKMSLQEFIGIMTQVGQLKAGEARKSAQDAQNAARIAQNKAKEARKNAESSQEKAKADRDLAKADEQMAKATNPKADPSEVIFGLAHTSEEFTRHDVTKLFDDQKMVDQLIKSMNDPISNFGPRNVPRVLRSVEIMGIIQARKWEIGTLNDFRDFFGMKRHDTFESVTTNPEIQNALRDLYEHPDKIELYPGVFCESDANMNVDPGPSDTDSALWAAIFSDAITLVRSDRFYTTDWNTNSLTSWGMKEVTPDNDNLKSSVFHRLIQRAFPGWFNFDAIEFFHPFYTGATNVKFAKAQGYERDFNFQLSSKPSDRPADQITQATIPNGKESAAWWPKPSKPSKPIYLDRGDSIKAALDSSDTVHPAAAKLMPSGSDRWVPDAVYQVLVRNTKGADAKSPPMKINEEGFNTKMEAYLLKLMRETIRRETITMDNNKTSPVYQIDIVRDFAIPVTAKFVADFLGFGHHLQSNDRPNARYSENEIYQHVTNCYIFFAYNTDETKLLRRRKACGQSLTFLYNLTKNGVVRDASRWAATRGLVDFFALTYSSRNPMARLGLATAQAVLEDQDHNANNTAAILLMIALDSAYNSVFSFTSVLDQLIEGLYKSSTTGKQRRAFSKWENLQQLAVGGLSEELQSMVREAHEECVNLPLLRKARTDFVIEVKGAEPIQVAKNQKIILDIKEARNNQSKAKKTLFETHPDLLHQWTFSQDYAPYHPVEYTTMTLTLMITVVAQMKNLRRGHDTQGRLKRIRISEISEGYENFMAPMRVKAISASGKASDVYDDQTLRPATTTYLTAEWDEFVPYPTTWKLRFEGFGSSGYSPKMLNAGLQMPVPDAPPFYQPKGPSVLGGSFAESACVCVTAGAACECKDKKGGKSSAKPKKGGKKSKGGSKGMNFKIMSLASTSTESEAEVSNEFVGDAMDDSEDDWDVQQPLTLTGMGCSVPG